MTTEVKQGIKIAEPTIKLKQTINDPDQLMKTYMKRYRCTIMIGMAFTIGAATLEILLPWGVALYFFNPVTSADEVIKHDILYGVYYLLFIIAFCSWIAKVCMTRASENMAKEMRYDFYHNYIVGLERARLFKKIQFNLANAFSGQDKKLDGAEINTFKYKKTDDFFIEDVDDDIETIMKDLQNTKA
jgi:hypothetical protein